MFIVLALVIVVAAAYVVISRDPGSARREALHAALERGEIGPEDYARFYQPAA